MDKPFYNIFYKLSVNEWIKLSKLFTFIADNIYFPLKIGFLFSVKAVTPSLKSSLAAEIDAV